MEYPEEFIAKFWSLIDRREPDDCWPWLGTLTISGYGQISFGPRGAAKSLRSNRLVFFLSHGHWPDNACHSCDNPPCCNPAHILDGTKAENQHDKRRKGRAAKGERIAQSKLTDAGALAIRAGKGNRSAKELSAEFGVSTVVVYRIWNGDAWTHLPGI